MKKVLIISSKYYSDISDTLYKSAFECLKDFNVEKIEAPGIFEIPVIISKYIKNYDAFIALGCVIKGETPHFELISTSVINGLTKLSIESQKPIGNGILTCLNKGQAMKRANKGVEAAEAVIQVLNNVPSK